VESGLETLSAGPWTTVFVLKKPTPGLRRDSKKLAAAGKTIGEAWGANILDAALEEMLFSGGSLNVKLLGGAASKEYLKRDPGIPNWELTTEN